METTEQSLYRLWQRTTGRTKVTAPSPAEWNEEVYHLSAHGRGLEEALKYLYAFQPRYEEFIAWLQLPEPGIAEPQAEDVLSKQDLAFWEEHGYVVVKDAVSKEQCAAARAAIWEFLDADVSDPESWYKKHEGKNGMMLSFFQHPALDANRRSPGIARAYRQLYGDTDIYLLMDKVSFNPPETAGYTFMGSPLHWDVSLHLPIPYVLQGLLYLDDVRGEDGAFHCVPGFHKNIEGWLDGLPAGANPRDVAIAELEPVAVLGNAGDLVIWHQALPHCATPNKGATPRLVQYIAYKPVEEVAAAVWE